jgi:hypothetical protein
MVYCLSQAYLRFRWAVCQLDTLGKCRNRLMLRKSLASLPRTLDETYDRILSAIDADDSQYAIRILRWLAFSIQPLSAEELSEVVAIDPERNPAFDSQEVLEDPSEVLTICSSLVTITTSELPKGLSKIITLAHYSVKEDLISDRILQSRMEYGIQEATCNEFIAKSCLGYLLQFQEPDCLSNENIKLFKLARYSAQFWADHARAAPEGSEALNRLIMELFSTENTQSSAYSNWGRIHESRLYTKDFEDESILRDLPSPLCFASMSGMAETVNLLHNSETRNRHQRTSSTLRQRAAGSFP